MLRSLTIKNFRAFRDLTIEPLARVNLIAGKNDVGKTGVLEALYLLFANADQFYHFPSAFRSSQERISGKPDDREQKDNFASFWRWLPHRNESIGQIQIIADAYEVQLDKECTQPPIDDLTFHYKKNASEFVTRAVISHSGQGRPTGLLPLKVCSTRHPQPTEDAELLNSLAQKKKKQKLIEALKKIEPRLEDLNYGKVGSEHLVDVDLGLKELIPLTQLGQGITRLFRFFSEMLVEEAKIVLIDEVENGIHHSVLSDVWKGLAMIATEEKLQVFATTHSWECVEAAHKAFASGDPSEFRLHRLEQIDGEIKAVTYDEESIDAALRFEMEVR
jgi:AAA15 family ATPase/GTPase